MEWFALVSVVQKIVAVCGTHRPVGGFVGKFELPAPRSWHIAPAGCVLPSSIFLLATIYVHSVPGYVILVELVVISCCKEVSGEIMLHKCDLNWSSDRDSVSL